MDYLNLVHSLSFVEKKEDKSFNFIWNARSTNKKTGDVPTLYIGHTKEEAWGSCEGCELRGEGCYAWSGSVKMGAASARRAFHNGADKSLSYALTHKNKEAKMLRISAIGDIGRCSHIQAQEIKDASISHNIPIVGYTHHWREPSVEDKWKGFLMASCESIEDADRAVSRGWRATCLVPENQDSSFVSKEGNKVVICPAQTQAKKGITLTCNDCRLCNASKSKLAPIIGFQVHGAQKNKAKVWT